MFVEVAVNLPHVHGTFDYHVPEEQKGAISLGQLITVPFGSRMAQGIIVAVQPQSDFDETRAIEHLLDPEPVLTSHQLTLAQWMSANYHASLIDCLTLMLPPGLSQKTDSKYHLVNREAVGNSAIQDHILKVLRRRGDLRGRQLTRALPYRHWRPAMDALVRQGVIRRTSVLDPPLVRAKFVRTARLAIPPEMARARVLEIGRPEAAAYQRRICAIETLITEGWPR